MKGGVETQSMLNEDTKFGYNSITMLIYCPLMIIAIYHSHIFSDSLILPQRVMFDRAPNRVFGFRLLKDNLIVLGCF